jgi:hypothetical protein
LRVWCDTDKGERDQAWRSDDDRRGKLLAGTISQLLQVQNVEIRDSMYLFILASKSAKAFMWVQTEFRYMFKRGSPIIIWHVDGDFYDKVEYDTSRFALSQDEFDAFTGEREFNNVISHMSNNRQTSIETVAAFINTHI